MVRRRVACLLHHAAPQMPEAGILRLPMATEKTIWTGLPRNMTQSLLLWSKTFYKMNLYTSCTKVYSLEGSLQLQQLMLLFSLEAIVSRRIFVVLWTNRMSCILSCRDNPPVLLSLTPLTSLPCLKTRQMVCLFPTILLAPVSAALQSSFTDLSIHVH